MSTEKIAIQSKVTQMPNCDELLKIIGEGHFVGTTDQALRFFMRFVDTIAGRKIDGAEINSAWMVASHDTLGDYPPMVQGAIGTMFDRVIDAIVPDIEVASQAKAFRLEVMQKAEEVTLKSQE